MSASTWRKCENEAGFPYYVLNESSSKQWDHPAFAEISTKVDQCSDIKYAMYRIAYKILTLQDNLKVPGVRVVEAVLAHHCLSVSESSFALEPCELEAVLSDVYFAAHKAGSFDGDVDLATDLALNLLLNVYDAERTSAVSVMAVRSALAALAEDVPRDKWRFLFRAAADHNACLSPRRLAAVLAPLARLAEYLGEAQLGTHLLAADVQRCFSHTPGMLGLTEHALLRWLTAPLGPVVACWLEVVDRARRARLPVLACWECWGCGARSPEGLQFRCARCWNVRLCGDCHLRGTRSSEVRHHDKSHVIEEIIHIEGASSGCVGGFIRRIKRVLNCSSESSAMLPSRTLPLATELPPSPHTKDKLFTSTVSKVAGQNISDPRYVLQDIITQLENQNKALQNLSRSLGACEDGDLRCKVDSHSLQIHMQISRLRAFRESFPRESLPTFGVLSPITAPGRSSRSPASPPRFPSPPLRSPTLPSESPTQSPRAADAVSSVRMSDISSWLADSEPLRSPEEKFNADLESVACTNHKMKELNADLDGVLDRLQTILANNFTLDERCVDNTQLQETADEMEGLLGSLIRGVESRARRSEPV